MLPTLRLIRPVLIRALYEQGGRARPSATYPLVTRAFPEITPEDLTTTLTNGRTNRWQNRVQWARQSLVLLGIIDATERGVWKLTRRGEDFARGGASAETLERAWVEFVSQGRAGPPVGNESVETGLVERGLDTVDDEPVPDPTEDAATVRVLRTGPATIIDELIAASEDSRDPNRFEQAVADAFHFLGYDVQWIGGAGRTDVLIGAPLGTRRYSVVVDAKSTARVRVADGQVDWLSIRAHREAERAQYACLVGPNFAGGQLLTRAREFDVALLKATDLAEVVRIHGETPLTLTEIRPLFLTVPSASDALPALRSSAGERRRRRVLLSHLLTHIDNFNRAQPDLVLAKPETLFGTILGERNPELAGTTVDDIREVLSLLRRQWRRIRFGDLRDGRAESTHGIWQAAR